MDQIICGIDEAGRGPVIGPMVVAGVWANEEQEQKLINLGVKDSKKHSASRRQELATAIKRCCAHKLITVQPEDIDTLRTTMTINQLEVHLFAQIAASHHADVYYLDAASTNEIWFGNAVSNQLDHKAQVISEHEADNTYPVVSASSIIAKVERDSALEIVATDLESHLNMPLGSGYPSDERTRKFIKAWIKRYGDVPPHTRRTWKTIQKLQQEIKQKRLF
jgi:ribonuclease HII